MKSKFIASIFLLQLLVSPTNLYAEDNCFNIINEPTKICIDRASMDDDRDHLVIIDVVSNKVISQIDEYISWKTLSCSDCPTALQEIVASNSQERLQDEILSGHFQVSPLAFNSYYDKERGLSFGTIEIGIKKFIFVRSSNSK